MAKTTKAAGKQKTLKGGPGTGATIQRRQIQNKINRLIRMFRGQAHGEQAISALAQLTLWLKASPLRANRPGGLGRK